MVPKKDGGLRPIPDLRKLNKLIQPQNFHMLTLDIIIPLPSQGDWFVVIDLQDTYFHILIHPLHQKFLQFRFNDIVPVLLPPLRAIHSTKDIYKMYGSNCSLSPTPRTNHFPLY